MRASRASLSSLGLVLVLAGGCRVDLPASPPVPAALDGIEPARGEVGVERAVTIQGSGFAPRVTQDLGAPDGVRVDDAFQVWLGDTPLGDVRFEDARALTAKVPADLPAGTYELVVVTPYDERLTLADAYEAYVEVIPPPASLGASLALPDVVSVGQTFTVTMTIESDGEATLHDVEPSALTQAPAGGATLVSAPDAIPTLSPGAEAELTWSYVAAAAGSYTFEGTASGTEPESGLTTSSPAVSAPLVVEEPPAFTLAWDTPSRVTRGQAFDVALLVENTGEAAALALAPGALALDGDTGTTCAAAAPPSVDLEGGAATTFTWSCTAGEVSGLVTLSVDVTGSDENAGTPVSAAPVTSDAVGVESAPALALAWTLPAGDLSYGQAFTLSLDVTNGGEAGATVSASAVTVEGTTGTVCSAGIPLEQALSGGATTTFTFACAAGTSSGSVTFAAGVSGSDDNSGAPAVAEPLTSDALVVESPPALRVEWAALPARVSFTEAFDADVTVHNDGEASALDVAPTAFAVAGSGTTCSGPVPASATVAPASQQTFRYACTAAAPSEPSWLFVAASGSDENDGAVILADSAESAEVLVGSLALLDLTLVSASDATVYRRQQGVRVELSVENLGEAAADVSSDPGWLAFSAGGVDVSDEYTVVPVAANPTRVAGGSTEVFAFDVAVSPSATLEVVTLDGSVDGADALDGTLTSDAGATTTDSWSVAINEPPVACFVSDVNAREVSEAFALDASCSSDPEGALLLAEWDFDGDGSFDAAPDPTLLTTHAFASEGVYPITLRVTDPVGFTSYASHTVVVAATGRLHLVTSMSPTGPGSFTAAVAAANDTSGPDTIAFDRAVFSGPTTVSLNNGQSPVLSDGGTRVVGHEGVRISATRGFVLAGSDNLLAYLEVGGVTDGECVDIDGSRSRVIGTRLAECDVGIRVTSDDNVIGPGNVFAGPYADDVALELGDDDNVIMGNRFSSCDDACVDFLFGARDATVSGNVIAGVGGDGVVLRGSGHVVLHNTFHAVLGAAVSANAFGHSVRGNVFADVLGGAICGAVDVDADYNDLFTTDPCDAAQGANSLSVDPGFRDAAAGDLRLLPTSPLIDAGDPNATLDVNGAAPGLYDGAAPDLGAFEHNPG